MADIDDLIAAVTPAVRDLVADTLHQVETQYSPLERRVAALEQRLAAQTARPVVVPATEPPQKDVA